MHLYGSRLETHTNVVSGQQTTAIVADRRIPCIEVVKCDVVLLSNVVTAVAGHYFVELAARRGNVSLQMGC